MPVQEVNGFHIVDFTPEKVAGRARDHRNDGIVAEVVRAAAQDAAYVLGNGVSAEGPRRGAAGERRVVRAERRPDRRASV